MYYLKLKCSLHDVICVLVSFRLLTDTTITTESDVLTTINLLHERGPHTVVLTSSNLSTDPNVLTGYASCVKGAANITKFFSRDITNLEAQSQCLS